MSSPIPSRLTGKRAVITGASSGLGLEMARRFIAEGAEVLITGTSQEKVDRAVADLGPAATGQVTEVRNLADLDALADAAKARWGAIDILVANAGVGTFGPFDQIAEEAFDWQFDINVKGALFTVQKLAALLGEGGSVILTGSAVNAKGLGDGVVYFATKAAIRSLARSLGHALAPRGIRVNALSPGLVMTGFQERSGNAAEDLDAFGQLVVGTAPMARLGEQGEIASAAAFLASSDASYMTGADLVVDGGFMAV